MEIPLVLWQTISAQLRELVLKFVWDYVVNYSRVVLGLYDAAERGTAMSVPSRLLFVFRISKEEREDEGARGGGGNTSGGEGAETFRGSAASAASRSEPDALALVPCLVAQRAADMEGFVTSFRLGGNLVDVSRNVGRMYCSSAASLRQAIMVSPVENGGRGSLRASASWDLACLRLLFMALFDNLSYCFVVYMSKLKKIQGFFLSLEKIFPILGHMLVSILMVGKHFLPTVREMSSGTFCSVVRGCEWL